MVLYVDLATRLAQVNVALGIALAMIGFGLILLAKKITFFVRKTDKIETTDDVYRSCLIVGIALILIGFIVSILY